MTKENWEERMAETAYNAYKKAGANTLLRTWDQLLPTEKKAWGSAVRAVAAKLADENEGPRNSRMK
jgi:hypothetical protein